MLLIIQIKETWHQYFKVANRNCSCKKETEIKEPMMIKLSLLFDIYDTKKTSNPFSQSNFKTAMTNEA